MKTKNLGWVCCALGLSLGGCSSETGASPAAAASTEGAEARVATAAASTPAAATAAPTMTTAELVKRYDECWGYLDDKKWDAFTQCYAENATSTWLDTGMPDATSRADIIEKQVKPFVAAFPDFKAERQLTLANGKTVLSIDIIHGTHEGTLQSPMGAVPATHKRIGLVVGHLVELSDQGQVLHEWFVQDMGTMMAQLGLSPAPARPVMEQGAADRPEVIATGSAGESANVAAGEKMYALFNAHDKAMLDMCAENVVDHNPSLPKDVEGKANMTKLMESFWKGFTNIHADTQSIWGAGDYTVRMMSFGGTNDGPAPSFGISKPTGKPFMLHSIEVTQWKDGKVAAMWPMFNGAAMAGQLGLIPLP